MRGRTSENKVDEDYDAELHADDVEEEVPKIVRADAVVDPGTVAVKGVSSWFAGEEGNSSLIVFRNTPPATPAMLAP